MIVGSQRFCMPPTIQRLHPNRRGIPEDSYGYSDCIRGYFPEGYEEGKRVVFDAANPADQSAELAREKAMKGRDQKASHKPIDISVERAIRGRRQRTTRTI